MWAAPISNTDGALGTDRATAVLPSALMLDTDEFAALLKERRTSAKLSQRRLARLAGISEPTIRNLEHARHAPCEETLKRLLLLPELGLSADLLPTRRKAIIEKELEYFNKLNCFVAPEYGLFDLWLDFRRQINTEGGHIEQTYLYLDPEAAYNYIEACNHSPFMAAHRVNMPLESMASRMIDSLDGNNLDIVALGPGDGQQESRLVRHVLDLCPQLKIRMHLIDISHPMLNVAYKHATDSLGQSENIFIVQIQANFHNLLAYQQFFYTPAFDKRRRVFVMLGATFANIDNEVRFVRHSLGKATKGDMLLLDLDQVRGSTEAEIRRNDPRLSRAPADLEKWLGGLIRRHCNGARNLTLRPELRLDCVIPDSYAIDIVATVEVDQNEIRDISMARTKRYNLERLCQRLESEGWECVQNSPYGANTPAMSALMLFAKR